MRTIIDLASGARMPLSFPIFPISFTGHIGDNKSDNTFPYNFLFNDIVTIMDIDEFNDTGGGR